jgi:hypothetical protein
VLGSVKQTRFVRLEWADVLARPEAEALVAAAAALATARFRATGRVKSVIRSVSAKQQPRRTSAR